MTDQQKIDYIYGRCIRLLDELDNDNMDRISTEEKLNHITSLERAYELLQHTEFLLDENGIGYDDPAEFVIQRYI